MYVPRQFYIDYIIYYIGYFIFYIDYFKFIFTILYFTLAILYFIFAILYLRKTERANLIITLRIKIHQKIKTGKT